MTAQYNPQKTYKKYTKKYFRFIKKLQQIFNTRNKIIQNVFLLKY